MACATKAVTTRRRYLRLTDGAEHRKAIAILTVSVAGIADGGVEEWRAAGPQAFMGELLQLLRGSTDAWPFLEPVSRSDVPDYYDVIKVPAPNIQSAPPGCTHTCAPPPGIQDTHTHTHTHTHTVSCQGREEPRRWWCAMLCVVWRAPVHYCSHRSVPGITELERTSQLQRAPGHWELPCGGRGTPARGPGEEGGG